MPLLCIGILTVTLTNLLIFDLGVSVYKVELPSDDMNESAAVSKSYLLFALGAGILFQLWHAFCTNMFGRYMLLICSVAVLSPWAERFIPLNMMKRHIWAMEEAQVELMLNQTQAELIEMARMDNRGWCFGIPTDFSFSMTPKVCHSRKTWTNQRVGLRFVSVKRNR